MKKVTQNEKRDHALFFVEKGDADFSPEHNKYIIEESIRKYELMRKRKQKDYIDEVAERSDAVSTFLRSSYTNYNAHPSVEKYFSRQELARLRGEEIANKLRMQEQMTRKIDELTIRS